MNSHITLVIINVYLECKTCYWNRVPQIYALSNQEILIFLSLFLWGFCNQNFPVEFHWGSLPPLYAGFLPQCNCALSVILSLLFISFHISSSSMHAGTTDGRSFMFSYAIVYFVLDFQVCVTGQWDAMPCQLVDRNYKIVGYCLPGGKFPEELNLRQHTLETQFPSGCDMFMYHAYFLV
jgi:hypothetical protein